MPEQSLLQCVSCESTFEPTPNGGFCPDCDTPHPEYGHQDTADESTGESADEESAVEVAQGDVTLEEGETDAAEGEASASNVDAPVADDGDAVSAVDSSKTVCPDCGAVFVPDADAAAVEQAEREEEADTGEADLTECPDCGHSITDEAYCPSCGTHLDAIRTAAEPTDDVDEEPTDDAGEEVTDDVEEVATDDADEETAEDEDDDTAGADDVAAETAEGEGDEAPESLTLVIDGESYTFVDGDTFGRQDEDWLDDLVTASGGPDAVAYISGEHLQFSIEDDGVYVTDVSRNGTELNGTELNGGKAKLEDGDTLSLAERARIDVSI